MVVSREQRHTPDHPCPICGGVERSRRGRGIRCYGFTSDGWGYCTREEYSGAAPWSDGASAYRHRLEGECRCGVQHGSLVILPHDPAPRRRQRSATAEVEPAGRIIATYDYGEGADTFQVVRFEPKTFRQRRPDPDNPGGWIWNLDGITPSLYHRAELLAADPWAPVFGVEGERDVEALESIGVRATCNPGGAGKWRPEYAEDLRGRAFIAWPDPDPPGQRHGDDMVSTTLGVAASVRRLEMPSDAAARVADRRAAGATDAEIRAELLALAAAAPVIQPEPTKASSEALNPDPCGDRVAALQAHIDQLEATLATAQERFRAALALDRNPAIKAQRTTVKAVAWEVQSALDGGRADADGWVKIWCAGVAENAGLSVDRFATHRKTMARDGLIEEKTEYEPNERIDPDTGEVVIDYAKPQIPRVYLRCRSVAGLLERAATWTPSPEPKKASKNTWGGVRVADPATCKHRNVGRVCRDCGTELPDAPDPQDADQGTPPAVSEGPYVAAPTLQPQDADQGTPAPPGYCPACGCLALVSGHVCGTSRPRRSPESKAPSGANDEPPTLWRIGSAEGPRLSPDGTHYVDGPLTPPERRRPLSCNACWTLIPTAAAEVVSCLDRAACAARVRARDDAAEERRRAAEREARRQRRAERRTSA